MNKPLSDSYLMSLNKKQIIHLLRVAEKNCEIYEEVEKRQYERLLKYQEIIDKYGARKVKWVKDE